MPLLGTFERCLVSQEMLKKTSPWFSAKLTEWWPTSNEADMSGKLRRVRLGALFGLGTGLGFLISTVSLTWEDAR